MFVKNGFFFERENNFLRNDLESKTHKQQKIERVASHCAYKPTPTMRKKETKEMIYFKNKNKFLFGVCVPVHCCRMFVEERYI